MSSIPDYAEQLRTADLRVTRPRVAVLEAVNAHPHADTETIFGAVRFALPDVSRQAVYDVLHALTAAGLVRKRVEAEPIGRALCIHNYGHGGDGVTLSWGCAREVVNLVGGG